MRQLVGTLVAYAERMNYENFDDFADGVAAGIKYAMGGEHRGRNGSAGRGENIYARRLPHQAHSS